VDQPTATIIGPVISAVIAALATFVMTKMNARSSKPTVYEFRFVHETTRDPWIRGPSSLARIARAICWVIVFLLWMFGVNTVMAFGAIWLLAIKTGPPDRLVMLASFGVVALVLGYWIAQRIEVKPTDAHEDQDDDD
jgi:hypothetical protein